MSMRVFATVAKNASFSAAAKKLNISKAMASKYVQYLEGELGVRLLNRTTRKLNLTEVGLAYYEKAYAILSEIEAAENSIKQMDSNPSGKIKIMAPPSFGAFHLSRALSTYLKTYPEVEAVLELSNRFPDIVEEEIDIAFSVGELDDSIFIARKVASARRVVCASPQYLEEHGIPETPESLYQHNCMIYSPRNTQLDWEFANKQRIKISGDIQCNDGDALRIAAIQGCGITQLPTYMVGLDIQSGRLCALLEEYEPSSLPIFAIYHHRRYLLSQGKNLHRFYLRFIPT